MRPGLPGPVHKRLAELAGTWDVSTRYVIGDKQNEGKATCEAKLILGGRFLQQEYTSRFQGRPFHVLQLLGYDNTRKKSIEIMLDTMGTGVLHNEGTVSDDGKVISNPGESLDPGPESPTSCPRSPRSSTATTSPSSGFRLTRPARKPRCHADSQAEKDDVIGLCLRGSRIHHAARVAVTTGLCVDLAVALRRPRSPSGGQSRAGSPASGTARRTVAGPRAAAEDDRANAPRAGRPARRRRSSTAPRCPGSGRSGRRGHSRRAHP